MDALIGEVLFRLDPMDVFLYLLVAGLLLYLFPRSTAAALVSVLLVGFTMGVTAASLVTSVVEGLR